MHNFKPGDDNVLLPLLTPGDHTDRNDNPGMRLYQCAFDPGHPVTAPVDNQAHARLDDKPLGTLLLCCTGLLLLLVLVLLSVAVGAAADVPWGARLVCMTPCGQQEQAHMYKGSE